MILNQKALAPQTHFTPRKHRSKRKAFIQNHAGTQHSLPLPKGHSPYALAKRAEYARRLEEAKALFLQAIQVGSRAESAVKDYCSILHQQRRTEEACGFLWAHRDYFSDSSKFSNLYENLTRQIAPSFNSLNLTLRIKPATHSEWSLRELFKNPTRISWIEMNQQFVLVHFPSHSAARKTLESFQGWKTHSVEWVAVDGTVQGPAGYVRSSSTKHVSGQQEVEEDFDLPTLSREPSENTAKSLLGHGLFDSLD